MSAAEWQHGIPGCQDFATAERLFAANRDACEQVLQNVTRVVEWLES
jgi:hypothetical protein